MFRSFRKTLCIFMVIVLSVVGLPTIAQYSEGGEKAPTFIPFATTSPTAMDTETFVGAGTAASPFLIGTAQELALLATHINAGTAPYNSPYSHFRLTNNINLNVAPFNTGEGWTPIGIRAGTTLRPFAGVFDGGGFTISGLFINRQAAERMGLFRFVSGGTIKNLTLENVSISGGNFTGGIAGYIQDESRIYNVSVRGNINGFAEVGGVVGLARNSEITDGSFTGTATNRSNASEVGGVVGVLANSRVEGGSFSGTLNTVVNSRVGGIAGRMTGTAGRIVNSTSSGTVSVSGAVTVGGIVGEVAGGYIRNSSSSISVNGTGTGTNANPSNPVIGGIVGYLGGGSIITSYATGNLSVTTGGTAGGIAGGVGSGRIESSYFTGSVSGTLSGVRSGTFGGVVGSLGNGIIIGSFSTGRVDAAQGTGGNSVAGGIVGTVAAGGRVFNSAALNPDVSARGYAGRIAGTLHDISLLANNVAYGGMTSANQDNFSSYATLTGRNGEDRSVAQMQSAAGFPFTVTAEPWTYLPRYLPGFHGEALAMPTHLQTDVTPSTPTATGIVISPGSATTQRPGSLQFTATVQGTNNPTQIVIWSVEGNTSAATTIDKFGYLTVATGETSTTFTVRAASVFMPSVFSTATVTISEPQNDIVEVSNLAQLTAAFENAPGGAVRTVYVTANITLTAATPAVAVPSGAHIHLVNGTNSSVSIFRTGTPRHFVVHTGGTLTLGGSGTENNITLTRTAGSAANTLGGGIQINGGTLRMYGGTITGNRAASGGGVSFAPATGGTFIKRGGEIRGNTGTTNGGGVGVFGENSVFYMYGGSINGNNAGTGGGVLVSSYGNFHMRGGMIVNNTGTTGADKRVAGNSTFTLGGGTDTDITGPIVLRASFAEGSNFTHTNGIFFNHEGTRAGEVRGETTLPANVTFPGNITIPNGSRIIVPSGTALTIPPNVTLTNSGRFTVDGNVVNHGIITGNGIFDGANPYDPTVTPCSECGESPCICCDDCEKHPCECPDYPDCEHCDDEGCGECSAGPCGYYPCRCCEECSEYPCECLDYPDCEHCDDEGCEECSAGPCGYYPCRCCEECNRYPCECPDYPDCEHCDDEGCEECSAGPCGYYPCRCCEECNRYPCECYAPPSAPRITVTALPNGTINMAYGLGGAGFQFAATGFPVSTWAHTGGTLPPGLTLTPQGLLRGTPTQAGRFSFIITASNGVSPTDSRTVSLVITEPTLFVTTAFANPGDTVDVPIRISSNPGFASMLIRLDFPDELTLTGYTLANAPGEYLQINFKSPDNLSEVGNYAFMGWIARSNDITLNGELLTLRFKVTADMDTNRVLPITATFENAYFGEEPPLNSDKMELGIKIENGEVRVQPPRIGDLNGDGRVTSADAAILARHLIRHHVTIDLRAADIDCDGDITPADLTRLMSVLVGHYPRLCPHYPNPCPNPWCE